MRERYFEPGDIVILDRLTVTMLDSYFGLTSTPGPPWRYETSVCCQLTAGDVAVVLETAEIFTDYEDHDKLDCEPHVDTYVRVLAPRGVGWIHANYIERV
jgi:hypothetical protein